MATYKKGILGVFTGKVGTVIGSTWNGVDYMKSLPKSSGKAPTPVQLEQRLKFAMVNTFFKALNPIIKVGFQDSKVAKTPFNTAVSYHMNNAIAGQMPDFEMDYPKVVISMGDLASPWNPAVTVGPGKVNFTWTDNSNNSLAKATDEAVVVTYCPDAGQYCYELAAARRDAAAFSLDLPPSFNSKLIHCWIAFFSADQKAVSSSVYVGTVTEPTL